MLAAIASTKHHAMQLVRPVAFLSRTNPFATSAGFAVGWKKNKGNRPPTSFDAALEEHARFIQRSFGADMQEAAPLALKRATDTPQAPSSQDEGGTPYSAFGALNPHSRVSLPASTVKHALRERRRSQQSKRHKLKRMEAMKDQDAHGLAVSKDHPVPLSSSTPEQQRPLDGQQAPPDISPASGDRQQTEEVAPGTSPVSTAVSGSAVQSRPLRPRAPPLPFLEADLEEKFIKGGGKGGQKVNKATNAVFLRHVPTNLSVKVHDSRSLDENRTLARKRLKEQFDLVVNYIPTKAQIKAAREREKRQKLARNKRKRQARAEQAAGNTARPA